MSESKTSPDHKGIVTISLEVAIKVGLVIGLVLFSFFIIKPFMLVGLWGIIIAISVYPLYRRLGQFLGNRHKLAALIVTLFFLLIIIVPVSILGTSLIEAILSMKGTFEAKQSIIPPPSADVQSWPLIGTALFNAWQDAYSNLTGFATEHSEQLIEGSRWLLRAVTGAGVGLLLFLVAIIVSGVLLVFSGESANFTYAFAERMMGRIGKQTVDNATITVRNVIRGILGVAFIQAVLTGLGFLVAGVPAAGLWAFIVFFLCMIQVGPILVMIPVLVFVFLKMSTLTFILLAIWCVPILLIDNILKPIMLGRKSPAPMLVVFLGAIGGFIYFGIIGLFVGSVILSLAYRLFLLWLYGESNEE